MQTTDLPIANSDIEAGRALLDEGCVKTMIFSQNTYQIEVVDPGDQKSYWTFLQMDDSNQMLDCFCTCEKRDKSKSCAHLAASILSIFRKHKQPLHKRYTKSLWYQLFRLLAMRHGYQPEYIKDEIGRYLFKIKDKDLCIITPKNEDMKKKFEEIVDQWKEETEQTSIKFSNLSEDEIGQWKRKNPSHELKFELSFWSDIAKWLLVEEDRKAAFSISFDSIDHLPSKICIEFEHLHLHIYLTKANWNLLLPALVEYDLPFEIFNVEDKRIEKIEYNPNEFKFIIKSSPVVIKGDVEELEEWRFVPKLGFFPLTRNSLLAKKEILKKDIPQFLRRHKLVIQKFLVDYEVHNQVTPVNYHIEFDEDYNLHIISYLFTRGDLEKESSLFSDGFAFIEDRGFFKVKEQLFDGLKKVIIRDKMPQFIDRNRHWLGKFEGFSIHVTSLEEGIEYSVDDKALTFISGKKLEATDIIDFRGWFYIKGQGFYSNETVQGKKSIVAGVEIKHDEVSDFIENNHEELEQIPHFFARDSFIKDSGVNLTIDEEGSIVVIPIYTFDKRKSPNTEAIIFGNYVYWPNEGFKEIEQELRIPRKYQKRTVIDKEEEEYFIKHELNRLKSYLIEMDTRLKVPKNIFLCVDEISRDLDSHDWIINFKVESEFGSESLMNVWSALINFKPHLFSKAGLLNLRGSSFLWLTKMEGRSFSEEGRLKLSTLDWIRLSVYQDIKEGSSLSEEERAIFANLMNFQEIHLAEVPNISGLKSKLRPYQTQGIRWLWFLYTYGLSGFLCDEMGLGKTHQAMALIAALKNYHKGSRPKILVVCPTSVIYHWEALLDTFLKKVRYIMYYGTSREKKDLNKSCDLILTSYGIFRSDKKLFTEKEFNLVILDEMQVAKNPKSQIHQSLKILQSDMKLALTGTPIENNLSELKALFDIILPQYFSSSKEFKEQFIIPIEKDGDRIKQEVLAKLISPFILRRKKTEVLKDLPAKTEEVLYVDMSKEQRDLYTHAYSQSKKLIDADLDGEDTRSFYMHIFALFTKLKQICNHPVLLESSIDHYATIESGKWSLFRELLDEIIAGGQKVVIFSQYLNMLSIMEKYLQELSIDYAMIKGSTRDRRQQVDKFQTDKECRVFLGSIQAAGVGIDLTAASCVIHYDRWWNPAVENQATDRVHRIGQKNRGVNVYKIVTKNSIEEHIHYLIEKKQSLIKNIIGFDREEEVKKIDRNELIELLHMIQKDI